MKRILFLLFFVLWTFVFFGTGHSIGIEQYEVEHPYSDEPWFTGSLLSPGGYVVPVGYMNIEPYVFGIDTFGIYDRNWNSHSRPRFWTVNPQFFTWIGLTKFMDFQIGPQFFWNETQGHSDTQFGDLPIGINFQILEEKEGSKRPAIKLVLRESFPTGKYQNLDPKKLGTDVSGTGTYLTTAGLVFARLFHIRKAQYLNSRLFVGYSVPSKVHVKGLNTYGGGIGTKGYVYPGWILTTIAGFEYSMTRNWVLALDIMNIYANKTRFRGNKGIGSVSFINIEGVNSAVFGDAVIGAPSSDQVTLAPAIEYNFNESVGIIGGCWFSIAGRNTGQFVSGVLAINYFFQISKKEKLNPVYLR